METAFFFTIVFPPPSSRTEILTGPHRPGTGRTADAHKSFIMQGIVGDIVLIDIIPDYCGIPMQQRVVFDHLVDAVPFDQM